MAAVADKVVVELELRDGQYLSRVRQNERVFSQAQRRTADSAEQAERRIRASSDGVSRAIRNAAVTIAAAVSVSAITRMADGYTRLQNSLRVAGLEGAQLLEIQGKLYDIANANGVEIESLSRLYSRVALNNQALNASQEELLQVTTAAAAALRVQGLSATEARGPLLQLAQTLGSDIARAEEYNSVIEGIPALAQAVARGLGVTTAQLGALVREGQVTTQQYFRALLAGSEELVQQSTRANLTIGQSFTVLNNELGRYIGTTDQSFSASQRLSQAILALADNLDRIAPALGAIIALVGVRYTGVMAGAAAATLANSVSLGALARAEVAATATTLALANAELANARAASAAALASGTLASSVTGLAAAQSRATAAAVAHSAALQANTTRAIAATGATRLLAGGMAFLGGPVGTAVAAVAALSLGIIYLGDRMKIQGQVTEDAALAHDALRAATDAYTEAANAAAIASGRDAAAKRVVAEEARRQAAAERDNAKAKLASAQATIALIQAEAARMNDVERFNIRGDRPGSVQTIGRERRQELADATATASASAAAIASANSAIAAADAAINARASAAGPSAPASAGRGGSAAPSGPAGPSAEELQALRDEIQLQNELDIARARGDEAEERRIQRIMDIRSLAEQMDRAGIENARELAEIHVQSVADIEDSRARQIEYQERLAMISQALIDYQDRENALLIDRLGYEAELARLSGDESAMDQAERRLFIEERINEILRLRPTITRDEARKQAGSEFDALENAAEIGEASRVMARGFIDIIRSDDIGAEIGRRFQNAAFDGLENLLTSAFRGILSSQGGGGFLGSIAGAFGFGGFRAGGGPVRAGFAYDVGENGRERFIAPANGFIAPNTESVSASPSGGGMAFTFAPVYQVQGYGQDIERLKQQMEADQASFSNRVAGAVNDGYRRGKVRLQRG